ncbi:MAG TPA: long-chain fatty acid--CoA ligase [Actinomycetes bacterium]
MTVPAPVVGDWTGRAAAYWPGRLALVDPEGGRFTYGELDERAARLAGWLRGRGLGKGDRVGVLARNRVEVLDAFFACGKLGTVLVPYNWRLHPRELGELAARTRPSALLYEQELAAGAAAVAAAAGPEPALAHLDGEGLDGSRPYADALAAAPPAVPTELDPEDVACLLFTGGTTGVAKAAMVSYRMIAWNTLNTAVHELQRDDVTITHTPLFHTGGLLVYTVPLLVLGGTVVLMRAWDPDGMLDLVERERVTLFFCVPTQYQMLLASERFARADLSSLRFVTSGGAPLPVSVIERWRAVHDTPFKQGFGMTEFGPGGFSMGPEHAVAKAGSIGRPNWFVSAAVVGGDGAPLAPGEVGELVLKGPSMFSGYFEDPAASAAAVDAAGWFHTGDLAYADRDGFYFIVDRKKDMFVSGGENVYPAEVERALCEHPAVLMCAVVGVPDERWGEVGRAFVVRRDGATAEEEELLAFLRTRLARYKQPRSVAFVPELPISPQGKVLKRLLRAP